MVGPLAHKENSNVLTVMLSFPLMNGRNPWPDHAVARRFHLQSAELQIFWLCKPFFSTTHLVSNLFPPIHLVPSLFSPIHLAPSLFSPVHLVLSLFSPIHLVLSLFSPVHLVLSLSKDARQAGTCMSEILFTPSNRMSCRDLPTSVPARRASFDRLRTRYRVEKQKLHLCSAHWRMALNLAPHLVTQP
jgi:hypothetical protein